VRKEIHNLGGIGVIKDLAPWQLPENAFTKSNNIRYADNQAGTFTGYEDYVTPTVVPYYVTSIADGTSYWWVYCGLDEIYAYDGSDHENITRGGGGGGNVYTGTASDRWNSTEFNGYLILNNNEDIPQSWIPGAANNCVNLITWDTDNKALVVRAYKDFLIALNLNEDSTLYPRRVRWSDAADSGSLPGSWDETSTSGEAGVNDLTETQGSILDGMPLRDSFYIYKEDSVYGMQYIGGTFIFRFWRVSGLNGALAQQCVADLGNRHFVLADGDCYVHDGQNSQSVIDKKNRDYLFSVIDADNYTNCFVRHFRRNNEVWVCYPSSGQTFPNKMMVWNYSDNTWTERDLNSNTASIANGIIADASYSWTSLPYATWNDWTGTWGSREYSPLDQAMVSVTTDTELFKHGSTNTDDASAITCTLEKTNIELGQGSHMIKAIHPYAEGQSFNVYIGYQDTKNASVTWDGPHSFDPSSDRRVNCRVTGRYHSVKFESITDVAWSISGYGIEYESSGIR